MGYLTKWKKSDKTIDIMNQNERVQQREDQETEEKRKVKDRIQNHKQRETNYRQRGHSLSKEVHGPET